MSFVKLLISEKCSEKPIGAFRSKQSLDRNSPLLKKKSVLYSEIMEGKKRLGAATLGSVLLAFLVATVVHYTAPNRPIKTKENFLSFGKSTAPIEVVLIEDFQCKNCRTFSKKLIPQLREKYIYPGKVRFTLVPVSFLIGSQLISNAALEVYQRNPNRFFSFLNEVLEHKREVRKTDLIRIARQIGGINLQKLQQLSLIHI